MVRNLQSTKTQSPQRVWSIALMGIVMLGTAAQTVSPTAAIARTLSDRSVTAQRAQSRRSTAKLPQQVALRVRRDLAQRFSLAQRDLRVVSFSRETWSDSCLGLAAPNERCAMATVAGWRIEITNGQQNWIYRTDLSAQVIKLETRDLASLPPQIVDRLFETIARQANVSANTLKVVESQAKTWDGCMGIFEVGRACTRIAISGYRVIVTGDRQSWVYHVDQEGSRIVQNATASGSSIRVTPSFIPADAQPPVPTKDIIFRLIVSGGMRGDTTETVLTSDGILYRKSTSMQASVNSQPTIIKRLSQWELQQFQQLLQQQKFPNLNGMRYLTSAVLADYPTTVVQAMGSSVAYVDLEQSSLPRSLQLVIRDWNRLSA